MPRKKAEAPKVSEPKKKPVAKKPAVKKPVAKPKATTKKPVATKKPAVKKPVAKPKATTKKPTPRKKPTTRKKPEPKPTFKRKELSHEQMFPYESFIYRLEYQDGTEHRVCHFQCEAHRTKHIERYKLAQGSYYIDTPRS